MICSNCPLGKIEKVVGNGITEPPYIWLVRCPFETENYKNQDDECNHNEEKDKYIKSL